MAVRDAATVADLEQAIADAHAFRPLLRCEHGRALRDASGEALETPCGCRATDCTTCGHDWSLHGRRGHGSCSHGRRGGLDAAVAAVRIAVQLDLKKEERTKLVDIALETKRCECRRFTRTPRKAGR